MYKTNSANMQGRATRLTLARAAGPEEIQTPEQQRENLKRVLRSKEIERKAETNPARWRRLGLEINDLCRQISALRPKKHGAPDTPQLFIDAAREILSVGQFRLIMDIATKRAREQVTSGG